MSRATRRTFITLLIIAVIGVALLLTGRDLFEQMLPKAPSAPPPSGAGQSARRGTVRFDDGTPAAGAVIAYSFEAADGARFKAFTIGPGGTFAIPEQPIGLTARLGPLSSRASDESLAPGESTPFDLRLPIIGALSGLVQTGAERRPVAGAMVAFGGLTTLTDEAGAFLIARIPASAFATLPVRLQVTAQGYTALDHAVPLATESAAYGDLLLLLAPTK